MSGTFVETGTILDRILARTASDVAERRRTIPVARLERQARDRPAPISLKRTLQEPGTSVIAEFKRASPSRGIFPVDVEPAGVAAEYLGGGAAALSVLTDEPFFRGSLNDLAAATAVAHGLPKLAPVLRKDFILDEYQLVEALAFGADAVLLIVAALDDLSLARLLRAAEGYGLDALVEVHDANEMRRAGNVGARLIGINNRDLRSFEVDLAVTERVAPEAPDGAVLVAESGIFTRADVRRLGASGVHAVLVGESLILASDRASAVRSLISDSP